MAALYKRVKWLPGMLEDPDPVTGWVYEHREAGAQIVGRKLKPQEVVHHIDEDKFNNDPSNLLVFRTVGDHSAHHAGGELVSHDDGTYSAERLDYNCDSCGGLKTGRYARCHPCYLVEKAKRIPPRAELEDLVWSMPTTKVAERYGVSDVAVGKWCKKLGISKPPRGYWRKIETNTY